MNRVRAGKLIFRDPVLLCGMVYLLLYFDASGFLRLGLLAAVLHELGTSSSTASSKGHLPVIEVTMTGFCMRTAGERLSPRQRFVLAVAGPAVNFALAGVWAVRLAQAATIRGSAFWAANLLTGLFNLCQSRRWMVHRWRRMQGALAAKIRKVHTTRRKRLQNRHIWGKIKRTQKTDCLWRTRCLIPN